MTNSVISVALFSRRLALALTQFSVGRLHRYLHRRTQNHLRAGAKTACLGSGSGMGYLIAEALELALVKATIRGHAIHLQVPYNRTSTGLNWLVTGTIIRTHTETNRRVSDARLSPQSETKSRRAEANRGNDTLQGLCRGVPLSDRATTRTIQHPLQDSRTSFVLSVP